MINIGYAMVQSAIAVDIFLSITVAVRIHIEAASHPELTRAARTTVPRHYPERFPRRVKTFSYQR
jgi:hypothetical protein